MDVRDPLNLWAPATTAVLSTRRNGDTVARAVLDSDGVLLFGAGSAVPDTNLYRASADTLKTDDNLIVGGNISAANLKQAAFLDVGVVAGTVAAGDDPRFGVGGPPSGTAGGVLSGSYPNPGFAVDMATQAELNAAVATLATDSLVVHKAGAETITGLKTHTAPIQVPHMSIGAPPPTDRLLYIIGSPPSTTATNIYGLMSIPKIPATAVTATGFYIRVDTEAATFAANFATGINVATPTVGVGSSVASVTGIAVNAMTTGLVSNFGVTVGAASTATLWLDSAANNTTANAGIMFGASRDTNLYRSAANVLQTDDSLVVAGPSVTIGTKAAVVGALRLPNAQGIAWRNAADDTDIATLVGATGGGYFQATSLGGYDFTHNGSPALHAFNTHTIVWGAYLNIGTKPAQSGTVRIPSGGNLSARNIADNGNLYLIGHNSVTDNTQIRGDGIEFYNSSASASLGSITAAQWYASALMRAPQLSSQRPTTTLDNAVVLQATGTTTAPISGQGSAIRWSATTTDFEQGAIKVAWEAATRDSYMAFHTSNATSGSVERLRIGSTGAITFNGPVTVPTLTSVAVPLASLTNFAARFPYGASTGVVQNATPWALMYHDLVAFNRAGTPTYETRQSGTWTADATDISILFAQKDASPITIDGTTKTGMRLTWNHALWSTSVGMWLQLVGSYAVPAAVVDVTWEQSADGVAWTTFHTSIGNSLITSHGWFWLGDSSTNNYRRLTIALTSGQLALSAIKVLTNRPGNQGGGKEFEYPYAWDSAKNIAFGPGAAPANGVVTVGSNTANAAGGLWFGTDVNLYRSAANVLQTDDAFVAMGAGSEFRQATSTISPFAASAPLNIRNTNATASNWAEMGFLVSGGGIAAGIAARLTNHALSYGDLFFYTRNTDGWQPRIAVTGVGIVDIYNLLRFQDTVADKIQFYSGYKMGIAASTLYHDVPLTGVHDFRVNAVSKAAISNVALTLADSVNVVLGSGVSGGTKIGTATGQKLGFWNAVPIAQPVVSGFYASDNDNTIGRIKTVVQNLLTALVNTGLISVTTPLPPP